MGTCVHFSRSLPSNSWWQTMVGCQVLSRPSAAEGGDRRSAFTGPATQPYSATEVDGWQRLSRVSQNRAAVHADLATFADNWAMKRAVEHARLIVAEAAKHLPQEMKDSQPDVPWQKIHGLGNLLRHEYRSIDPEVLWSIVTEHLDTLDRAA